MKSMTGFGVARGKVGRSRLLVEARSVNHRFCEVTVRFPGRFSRFEPEASQLVRETFARGKFDLFLREESTDREDREVVLARRAAQVLRRIQKELGLQGPLSLAEILAGREVLSSTDLDEPSDRLRPSMLGLVRRSLDNLDKMRVREGGRIRRWLSLKARRLERLLRTIKKHSARRGADYRKRIERKWKSIGPIEEGRLLQEAALMQERADVTEEIVRLGSHLKEFERFLGHRESVGRKFDFLTQEMGREINTIGSKSQGVQIARQVIEFKSELERIKEQVQNIE